MCGLSSIVGDCVLVENIEYSTGMDRKRSTCEQGLGRWASGKRAIGRLAIGRLAIGRLTRLVSALEVRVIENWDNYRIFLACYRSGSLRGGAKALGVNHATVARALGSLEEGLGAKVFHRSVGGLQLSDTGRLLVQYVQEIEQQAQHIHRRIAGLDAQP